MKCKKRKKWAIEQTFMGKNYITQGRMTKCLVQREWLGRGCKGLGSGWWWYRVGGISGKINGVGVGAMSVPRGMACVIGDVHAGSVRKLTFFSYATKSLSIPTKNTFQARENQTSNDRIRTYASQPGGRRGPSRLTLLMYGVRALRMARGLLFSPVRFTWHTIQALPDQVRRMMERRRQRNNPSALTSMARSVQEGLTSTLGSTMVRLRQSMQLALPVNTANRAPIGGRIGKRYRRIKRRIMIVLALLAFAAMVWTAVGFAVRATLIDWIRSLFR